MAEQEFYANIRGLREAYNAKRDSTNLYPPGSKTLRDLDIQIVKRYSFWYEDENSSSLQCVRIYDVPGTLSGDILRLNAQLPVLTGDCEIEGDIIRPLENAPAPPQEYDDDSEDVATVLDLLPVLASVSRENHFLKQPKYSSEIINFLKCQGGTCPGTPLAHVVQLLGKTEDGRLVFPRLVDRRKALGQVQSLDTYFSWFKQLVDGVGALHSYGIIHRDLRADNLLWTTDGTTLFICDLESRWGRRDAPEILRNDSLDAGWSEASDIWDIGECIRYILYGNAPINDLVDWQIPAPFTEIVAACQRIDPQQRPSCAELGGMLRDLRHRVQGDGAHTLAGNRT